MYTVENIEKLTQIFNKIEILGICTHEKSFQTEFIIYLQTKKKKIQIQSFVPFPDEAKIIYKEVKDFTLPFCDSSSRYFLPTDTDVIFKLDSAKNIEYSFSEAAKLGDDQILFSKQFSIGIESEMRLVINDAYFTPCLIENLIEKIL